MAFRSRSGSTVAVDLDHVREGKWWWQRREEDAASSGTLYTYAYGNSMLEPTSANPGLSPKRENSASGSERSLQSWSGRPQVVRSMLDV
jgi:hypothetical protein